MNIYEQPIGYIIQYPIFEELANTQMDTFWSWKEPLVENDVQDLKVNLTKAELHGLVTVLKLFTLYELEIGSNYWADRIGKVFKRPEIQRMCTMFAATEYNSHAPFYNEINRVLFINTPEFYSSYKEIEQLNSRIEFINKAVSSKNDLISIAAFSLIEGAILYSSFAFIKHFQAQRYNKNLIKNICRGIDLSVADEDLHSIGGATLFNTIIKEQGEFPEFLVSDIYKMADEILEHETGIIDIMYAEGDIPSLSKAALLNFVKHRINTVLVRLGLEAVYTVDNQEIEEWFYDSVSSVKLHDFFSGSGSEYNINWKRSSFGEVW